MTVVGDDDDIPSIDGRETVSTAAIKDPEGPNLETGIRMQMFDTKAFKHGHSLSRT